MAGEIVVGAVAVDIVPSAKNFLAKLAKEIAKDIEVTGKAAGEEIEQEISKGAEKGIKDGLKKGKQGAAKEGAEAGEKFSGGFAAAVKAGMQAAQAAIGSITVDAEVEVHTSEARAELIALKEEIAAFRDKEIDINLNAAQVLAQAAAIKAALAELAADRNIDFADLTEIRNSAREIDKVVERMQSATTQTGAFASKVDNYFKGLNKSLTDIDFDIIPKLDKNQFGPGIAQLRELRDEVARFRQDNAKGLFTGDEVKTQIESITNNLDRLKDVKLPPRLRFEVEKIRQSTDAIARDLFEPKQTKTEVDADKAAKAKQAAEEKAAKAAQVAADRAAKAKAAADERAAKAAQVAEDKAAKAAETEEERAIRAALRATQFKVDAYNRAAKAKETAEAKAAAAAERTAKAEEAAAARVAKAKAAADEKAARARTVAEAAAAKATEKARAEAIKQIQSTGFAGDIRKVADRAVQKFTIRPELEGVDRVYTEAHAIVRELEDIKANIGITISDREAIIRMAALDARLKVLTRDRSIHIGVDRDVRGVGSVLGTLDEDFKAVSAAATGAAESASSFGSSLTKFTPAAAAANAAVVGLFLALPAIIAVVNTAVLGLIGLITTLGAVAGVAFLGIAVAVAAFSKIIPAIQAADKVAKNAGKDAAKSAGDAARAAQTAFNNAVALRNANRSVAQAEKAVAKARADATKSIANANKSLVGAQRNLVQANDREKTARTRLSKAYVDAKQDLKDLNDEIKRNRAEQAAQIVSVQRASQTLAQLSNDPTSSGLDIAEAQAKLGQERAQLTKLQNDQAKNLTQKSQYDKLGLEANPGVIAAQEQVKSAVESVRDAQDSVATAAENAAQAQIDAADRVNDAEESLAQARQSRADTIRSQQLAAAVAAAPGGETGNADQTALDQAMAELTEKGKAFVQIYQTSIKPVIDELFAAAQDSGILTGVVAFFEAMKPALDPLKNLIGTVGFSFGLFLDEIGKFLGSAEGIQFINFLTDLVKQLTPVMASLAKSGLKIFFRLFQALAPVIEKVGPKLAQIFADLADRFVAFTETEDFQRIMDELIRNAPLLVEFALKFGIALLRFMVGIAPYTDTILNLLLGLLDFFNSIPISEIQRIVSVFVVAGLTVFTVINVLNILAVTVGYVIGLIIVWVARLLEKWTGGWDGIKKAFSDAWDFIKRIFKGAAESFMVRWDNLRDNVSDIWDGLFGEDGVVRKAFTGFVDWLRLALDRAGKIIRFGLAAPVLGAIFVLNDVISALNLVGKVFDFKIDPIEAPERVKEWAKNPFARGGIVGSGVQRSMRDEVPAMLRRGEAVVVPEAVQQLGAGTILDWNRKALLGQKIRHFAYGGLVDEIVAFERKSGVPFKVTSAYKDRIGSRDYHGQGMAVDTADSAQNMVRLASWLYGYSPYLLELIHSGGAGYFVKHGARKGRGFYGAATVADHYDHVHTAMNRAGLNAVQSGVKPADGPDITGGGSDGGSLLTWALDKVKSAIGGPVQKFLDKFGKTQIGRWLSKGPEKLLDKITPWLREKAASLGGDILSSTASGVGNFFKNLLGIGDDGENKNGGVPAHSVGIAANPQTAAAYAKAILPRFGFGGSDYANLVKLWIGESGWRWNARNPSSGAYGIPQSLPASKMAAAGGDWSTNAFTQILWGLNYIKGRYGNPTVAYQTWLKRVPHWYDTGGYLPPGLTLAYNGTGRNERVMTYEQEQDMMRERMALAGGMDVNVKVHDGAIPGLVTVELDKQFGALADSYVYGTAR